MATDFQIIGGTFCKLCLDLFFERFLFGLCAASISWAASLYCSTRISNASILMRDTSFLCSSSWVLVFVYREVVFPMT